MSATAKVLVKVGVIVMGLCCEVGVVVRRLFDKSGLRVRELSAECWQAGWSTLHDPTNNVSVDIKPVNAITSGSFESAPARYY